MTSTDSPAVDNRVNIEALRGSRQALTDALVSNPTTIQVAVA